MPRHKPRIQWRLAHFMRLRGIGSVGELHRRLTAAGYRISSSHIYRLHNETGPDVLPVRLLLTLAQVLDCSLDDLLRFPPGTTLTAREKAPCQETINDMVRKVPFRSFLDVIPRPRNSPRPSAVTAFEEEPGVVRTRDRADGRATALTQAAAVRPAPASRVQPVRLPVPDDDGDSMGPRHALLSREP